MVGHEQQNGPTEAPYGGLLPLFSTWIYLGEDRPRHRNEGSEQLAPTGMQDQRHASQRANCESWHRAVDLRKLEEPVLAEFRAAIGRLWSHVGTALLDLATTLPARSEQARERPHAQPIRDLATPLPARRPELVIRPLGDRGRYVVKDPHSGAFYTFGEQEHFLLTQLDGTRDAEAICQAFAERFGEHLSAEDLGGFLKLARRQDLLQPAGAAGPRAEARPPASLPAAAKLRPTAAKSSPDPARPRQSILYWRKKLFDPDRLFTWLAPRLEFVWTRPFLAVSTGGIVLAAAVAWASRHDLISSFADAWRWQTALLVWLTLIVATTLHEFAHGLTCKHHGGEVHEVGFLMMFFMPCFYCNVSDAWLFKEKSKRLAVTLAGGYFDLCLWALAVFLWRLSAPESLVNYLAWVVLSVLGARVFFNFNPLLKLDGYYLLSDWLELPNLRQRAWELLAGWIRCVLWGAPRPAAVARARLLLAYGLASWLFSLFFLVLMLVGFSHFLGANWGLAGVGLAVALAGATLPRMFQGFAGGEVRKMLLQRRKRVVGWLLGVGGLAAVLAFVSPEERVGGPFEVWPATRAEVRAPVAGFLREIFADEGERVYSGAALIRLEIPDLDSQLAQKRAAVCETEARLRLLKAGPRPEEVAEQRGRLQRARAWRDLATQDLERARSTLRDDLLVLDEEMKQNRAEEAFCQEVLNQSTKLVGQQAIPKREYWEAEKQMLVARSRQQEAEARKRVRQEAGTHAAETELAKRQREVDDAQAVLRLLEAGPRAEEVEAEQARLARLREEVLYLEGQQGKLLVYSPVLGLVTTPRLKEKLGRYVHEGDLICEVEGSDELEAEVALPEADAARVGPGQRADLKLRALPLQTLTARVDRVAPRAARTAPGEVAPHPARGELPSTVIVSCRLEGTDPGLRPGMTGHARIGCGQRSLGEQVLDRVLRYLRTEFWW
jgi:putative peptide zinc metalloprotease protein